MQNNYSNHNNVNEKFSLFKRQYTKIWVRLIRVFKQQFLIFFLEIRMGEKVYGNTCNVI